MRRPLRAPKEWQKASAEASARRTRARHCSSAHLSHSHRAQLLRDCAPVPAAHVHVAVPHDHRRRLARRGAHLAAARRLSAAACARQRLGAQRERRRLACGFGRGRRALVMSGAVARRRLAQHLHSVQVLYVPCTRLCMCVCDLREFACVEPSAVGAHAG